ncbi:DUF3142 domain-containing protein [Nannocystaceae bacterium ST9]
MILSVLGCDPEPEPAIATWARASGPIEHSAYVWQRGWGGSERAVEAAVEQRGAAFAELLVLAAEIDPEGRDVEVEWDADALARSGARVGLVVRVGPWSFGGPDRVRARLIATAIAQLERARAAGLDVVELQIDFDAASRSLADYREWLLALRAALAERPDDRELALTITALPDWLARPELPALLADVDGWVLQVHSLMPPTRAGTRELIDPEAARAAVERAATLGRPFRVALPTHHYLVARDSGSLLVEAPARARLAAEQAPADPSRERFDRAGPDPDALAELIAEWTDDRPRELIGVVWFRLPVAGDRMAWSWPTLHAVMAGRAPIEALALEVCSRDATLHELALINQGEADVWTSELAALHVLADHPLLAHDALAGFVAHEHDDALTIEAGSHRRLAPGESLAIGWLRFEGPTTPSFDMPTIPCTRKDSP